MGIYAAPFVRDTWAPDATTAAPARTTLGPVAPAYFSYRKTTIYAGSSEIQKNIITKLVLGFEAAGRPLRHAAYSQRAISPVMR